MSYQGMTFPTLNSKSSTRAYQQVWTLRKETIDIRLRVQYTGFTISRPPHLKKQNKKR